MFQCFLHFVNRQSTCSHAMQEALQHLLRFLVSLFDDPILLLLSLQLLPYFVLKTMEDLPGLPGLFIASIFSASISTLSSGINSLGAVTLEDVFKPLYHSIKKRKPARGTLTKVTVFLGNEYRLILSM